MRYKAMDFFHGIQNKHHKRLETLHFHVFGFHVHDMNLAIIKIRNSRVLIRMMTRALFLSLVIVSFPWLNMIMNGDPSSNVMKEAKIDAELGLNPLNKLFQDLANEGLVKMGDRALFLTRGNDEAPINARILTTYNTEVISYSDFEQQSLIPDETYDFIFAHDGFQAASNMIDRTLKKNGFVAIQMGEHGPRKTFQKPPRFKIVYLRRFGSTIVGMKKIGSMDMKASATSRHLLGLPVEAKKAVLSNLEDVLLEPPRAASGKSKRYFKRTRYLPDLTGDSLESYRRRIFINVDLSGNNDVTNDPNWFSKHYPTRNRKFEIYNIETVMEEPISSGKTLIAQVGMSDWLRKNVQENEYVVMKAEAEVVEEMVKSKAIKLVDELFLECKHRGIKNKSSIKSKKAYWECLALYGMLRDEGIAVHQWWG